MTKPWFFLLIAIAILPDTAESAPLVYQWKTPDGRVHFSDDMPASASIYGYSLVNQMTGEIVNTVNPKPAGVNPPEVGAIQNPTELVAPASVGSIHQPVKAITKGAKQDAKMDEFLGMYPDKNAIDFAMKKEIDPINESIDGLKKKINASTDPNINKGLIAEMLKLNASKVDIESQYDEIRKEFRHYKSGVNIDNGSISVH